MATHSPIIPGTAGNRAGHAEADLLDLLRAIHEAIDIPLAATEQGRQLYARALQRRAWAVQGVVEAALEDPLNVSAAAAALRQRLVEIPVPAYVTSEEAEAALAAGRTWEEATDRVSASSAVRGQVQPDPSGDQDEPDLEIPSGRYPELRLGGEL